MSRNRYLCIHAHFDQPPRGNPATGQIGTETSAGDFRNWNERATAESYRPNAEMGNFERISFDIGQPLMAWLKRRAPETFDRIVRAERISRQQRKVGNALGTPMYHAILPLLKPRDITTQLYWGREAFRHNYGHYPNGLWLPEMAVDMTTLRIASSLGYTYVILAQGQVQSGDLVDGGGPYDIDLGNGRSIAAYIRNDELSNDLSFNIQNVGGAGHWARNQLSSRRGGTLTLIAVDGETFGHHHIGEEQFLHYLLEHEASSVGYHVVTLDEYIRDTPPRDTIEIKSFSSWNCYHGLSRWLTGCACTIGDSRWKPAFLHAVEAAANTVDDLYQEAAYTAGVDPWRLRNDYVRVWLNDSQQNKFLADHGISLTSDKEARLLSLLQAEAFIARSYTSDALYHDDVDRREAWSVIASVAYAITLAEQGTDGDIHEHVLHHFSMVKSPITNVTGAEMYETQAREFGFMPQPVIEDASTENDEQSVIVSEAIIKPTNGAAEHPIMN
jgi:alpha-amylase/alpha-mannosidase (GH57 family)